MKETRKTPRQERSRALVDSILTATVRVLSSFGLEESTTTRIAERAGVSIGSLYQYFRNRDELLGALVDRLVEENVQRFLDELQSGKSLDEQIEAIVRHGLATFLDRRAIYAPLLSYAPVFSRISVVVRARKRLELAIARELRSLAHEDSTVDFEVAAFVAVNAFMGVILVALQDEPRPRDVLQDELTGLLKRYLLRETDKSLDRPA
jgi:AcrR family transcriptional regulator